MGIRGRTLDEAITSANQKLIEERSGVRGLTPLQSPPISMLVKDLQYIYGTWKEENIFKREAVKMELPSVNTKDIPRQVQYQPEKSEAGICPACGKVFDFKVVYENGSRCPHCGQLFKVDVYIT